MFAKWVLGTCRISVLLTKSAKSTGPLLLKRGMSATIAGFVDERPEYILSEGNANVFLCERECKF